MKAEPTQIKGTWIKCPECKREFISMTSEVCKTCYDRFNYRGFNKQDIHNYLVKKYEGTKF